MSDLTITQKSSVIFFAISSDVVSRDRMELMS